MNKCAACLFGVILFSALVVLARILLVSNAAYVFTFMVVYVWVASILLWICCGSNRQNMRMLYLMNFALLYILIVGSSYGYGLFLEYKLDQFDLDGDSLFSVAEQTPEQQRYMQLLVNDAGRNLAILSGAIYSVLSTAILFAFVRAYGLFARNR